MCATPDPASSGFDFGEVSTYSLRWQPKFLISHAEKRPRKRQKAECDPYPGLECYQGIYNQIVPEQMAIR